MVQQCVLQELRALTIIVVVVYLAVMLPIAVVYFVGGIKILQNLQIDKSRNKRLITTTQLLMFGGCLNILWATCLGLALAKLFNLAWGFHLVWYFSELFVVSISLVKVCAFHTPTPQTDGKTAGTAGSSGSGTGSTASASATRGRPDSYIASSTATKGTSE